MSICTLECSHYKKNKIGYSSMSSSIFMCKTSAYKRTKRKKEKKDKKKKKIKRKKDKKKKKIKRKKR